MSSAAPHLIIDDFLPDGGASALLAEMIAAGPGFAPSLLAGSAIRNDAVRSSRRLPGRIGVDLDPFRAAIHARFDALCTATGVAAFPVYHTECSIVAHGDGDFYRTHIDTRTDRDGADPGHYRVLSCVYYLHQAPRKFLGGELVIYNPVGGAGTEIAIEPRHNRLVAFPAFIPHEVLAISCPGGEFADSRFSVNCWLHRARGA
jgi:SM-20-related protein